MTSISERPDLASDFINAAHARYSERPHAREETSAGLTGLVTCLEKTWLRRHGEIDYDDDSEEFKLIVTVGSAYHGLLPPMDAPREQHVRLTVPDVGQVTCYIDWLEPEDPSAGRDEPGNFLVPCELKTTRSSANKPPSDHYIEQVAGEVALSGQTRGRLYVLYLAGNYRPPMPQMKVYEVEFSEDEMEDWREELGRRLAVVLGPERPPRGEMHSWECKHCNAKALGICDGGKGEWDTGTFFDRKAVSDMMRNLEEDDG